MFGACRPIEIPPPVSVPSMSICFEEVEVSNLSNPEVWGEAFWFMLHLGAASAPEFISPEQAMGYWGFVEGIPLMIPCRNCSQHARQFIAQHRGDKQNICSTRGNLFDFFIRFHNAVNKRTGKPLCNSEDMYKKFTGGGVIKKVRYF